MYAIHSGLWCSLMGSEAPASFWSKIFVKISILGKIRMILRFFEKSQKSQFLGEYGHKNSKTVHDPYLIMK